MKILTEDAVRHYKEEGFHFPERVMSAEDALWYRREVERTCSASANPAEARKGTISYRVKPYLLFEWAAELVRHPRVLDAVEDLIGPDILVFHTTMWWKTPGSSNRVPWHQDGTYFGLAPFEHVTAWVALSPSNLETGCVRIVPRTHGDGQLPHADVPDPDLMLSRGQTVVLNVDESKAVPVILSPGEISLHHTMAIHASDPNTGTDDRIGIGISYIPAHVRHVGPTRLTASLVRGEDRYGHFDLEPRPLSDLHPDAVAAHRKSDARFWEASRSIPEMAGIH
ncbi:MAG TPA: phytanoyl-CoA dioxygenase family protein [Rhodopila sp.]|uniref:phytanoyl-CoA dioxygenase family protein n=1 Tax=Rhodopila sp. TaxID=2480087 RepID=UPI002D03CDB7|nr:phytanoyl-CoA dioxygenase family protein [Rhodopila sp.]HVY15189.1 phytanoyl-CoA dioxygenase family protein [Rhodopila sp.]